MNRIDTEHASKLYFRLGELPADVLLCIVDYLSASDAATLSLVCHSLYDRLGSRTHSLLAQQKGNAEWMEFLQMLEGTLADHELCFTRKIFHKRRVQSGKRLEGPKHDWLLLHIRSPSKFLQCYERVQILFGCDYELGFGEVRLAMDRHRYGPPFGIELFDLTISTDWLPLAREARDLWLAYRKFNRTLAIPCFQRLEVQPRIVDNQLLLRIKQMFWFLKERHRLQRCTASYYCELKACPHQWGHGLYSDDMNKALSAALLAITRKGWKHQQVVSSGVYRCSECSTDFDVTIHNQVRGGVEVILDTWQNLGTCRTPWNAGWSQCWGSWDKVTLAGSVDRKSFGTLKSAPAFFDNVHGRSASDHPSADVIRTKREGCKRSRPLRGRDGGKI